MPGPVSDSYDPVWGTTSTRGEVLDGIRELERRLTACIGGPPKYILDVINGPNNLNVRNYDFSQRELRILRYAVRVALGVEDL